MNEKMKKEQVMDCSVSQTMLSASFYQVEAELDRLWERQHQQKYSLSRSGISEWKEIPS